LVEQIGQIASRKQATPAQIALAWLLARKPFIAPIPGTTKPAHLQENMAAASIKLTAQDMKDIEDGYANIHIIGKRAAPNVFKFSDIGSVEGTSSRGTHGNSPLPSKL
jgi:diketogulonate reductase-like aldo/keto reductase